MRTWLPLLIACKCGAPAPDPAPAPPDGAAYAACADLPCRTEAMLAVYAKDKSAAASLMGQIEDRMEARVMLDALSEADPGGLPVICPVLKGASRARCDSLLSRPHLTTDRPAATPATGRTGGGPPTLNIVPAEPPPRLYQSPAPVQSPCDDRPDQRTCLEFNARRAAERDELDWGAALCHQIVGDPGTWECFFRMAEAYNRVQGGRGYEHTAALCAESGSFAPNCHQHVVMAIAERAPAADEPRAEGWVPISAKVAKVEAFWAEIDPDFGRVMGQIAWGKIAAVSYSRAQTVTGDVFDHTPDAADPQLLAAAAFRLVEDEGEYFGGLEDAVETLDAAVASRSESWKPPDGGFRQSRIAGDLWPTDRPGDASMPAIPHLAVGRRTVGTTAEADQAIVLIEAAARMFPPLEPLIEDGQAHEDVRVRWTAERVMAQLAERPRDGPDKRADPAPKGAAPKEGAGPRHRSVPPPPQSP